MVDKIPKYKILFSKKAQKDITNLTAQQKGKLKQILEQVIAVNPYAFHDFNFIFTVKDFNKDSGVKSEGVVSIFTILFLTVITSSVLSFISNMKIGALYRCIISCFVLVPHFLFYMGNSRLSLVIGALAWLMVLVRLYPDYNLKVKYSLISLVGFSFFS